MKALRQMFFPKLYSQHFHKYCLRFPLVGPFDLLMPKKKGEKLDQTWSGFQITGHALKYAKDFRRKYCYKYRLPENSCKQTHQ